ncbi:MAG: DMT family transporter [Pseudomonadota bacterium]
MSAPPPGPPDLSIEPAHRDNLRGLTWILFSVIASSAMSVAVRPVSLEVDSRMVVMLRAGITCGLLLVAIPLIWRYRDRMRFSRPRDHLIRGALIAFSTHLGFYTLASIPLATASVLFFTAPIFATLLAMAVHGERVGPRRIAAVGAGFAGALIILRPGFRTFEPAMLAALGSSLLFALALTMSRGLARADGPMSTYVSSVVVTAVISLPLAAPVLALPVSTYAWVATAVLVVAGGARGVADIQAYRYGDAAVLAPVTYLRLVFVGIAGYLMFDERIDGPTLLGAAIIVTATLYIAQRERMLKKED